MARVRKKSSTRKEKATGGDSSAAVGVADSERFVRTVLGSDLHAKRVMSLHR